LLDCLVRAERDVHLVVSPFGRRLLADELDISTISAVALLGRETSRLTIHSHNDLGSPLASGSFLTAGMIICPCSANTMGAVASGVGDNLIHRAAQVTLKEMRRLVFVYREMPMSQIDLNNALTLSRAGAVICPASPGFYLRPERIEELVDFVVGKLLDLCGVEHSLDVRWDPNRQNEAP
jgi:4-hydroxy-3-polyprenylbenzoate decarboxylase